MASTATGNKMRCSLCVQIAVDVLVCPTALVLHMRVVGVEFKSTCHSDMNMGFYVLQVCFTEFHAWECSIHGDLDSEC